MKTVNQLIDKIDNHPCSCMNETLFEIRENLKFIKRTIHMGGFAQVVETDKIEELLSVSIANSVNNNLKTVKTEKAVTVFDNSFNKMVGSVMIETATIH